MNLDWYKSLPWYIKTGKIRKVLFVCTANTCRSPAAEYYFNHLTKWWDGLSAFSRGAKADIALAETRKDFPQRRALFIEEPVRKVVGDRTSKFLSYHQSKQLTINDLTKADLVLTMTKKQREELQQEYPYFSYKIFTLRGFAQQNDERDTEIPDPYIPEKVREKEGIVPGKVGYRKYLQRYILTLEVIEQNVRKVIEAIYLLRK
jgi:protein-tyrosine-phosphatase